MKKYKDLLITVAIILVVGLGTYFLSASTESKEFRKINYSDYSELVDSGKNIILYVGEEKDTTSYEAAKTFAKEKKLQFKYIYADDLSEKQKEELNYETSMIIYNEDEENNVYDGDFSTASLGEFFEELELIAKTYATISVDEYLDLVASGEQFVVFLASESCGYCTKFKPVVNEVIANNNIVIYHLDLTNLTNDDYSKLTASNSFFTEQEWGTPTTLIFKDKNIVDVLSGYVELATLENFLRTNKVID